MRLRNEDGRNGPNNASQLSEESAIFPIHMAINVHMTASPFCRFMPSFLGFVLLVCPGICHEAAGQGMRPEFKLGVAASTIRGSSNTDFSVRSGFAGGVGLTFELIGGWRIQPEILYVVKGANADFVFDNSTGILGTGTSDGTGVPVHATFDLTYLEIPVLLVYAFQLPGRITPKIFAGPSFSSKLDARVRFKAVGGSIEQEETDDSVQDFDAGAVVGAGIELTLGAQRLSLGARGTFGFSNARNQTPALHNTSYIFFAGISF